MTFKKILTVFGVLALAATSAFADIAYIGQSQSGSISIPPLQGWTGSLGMDFDVSSAITIQYMGVYNAFALTDTELASPLEVAIFNRDTGQIVAATDVKFQADTPYLRFLPVDVYDLFQAVTPVTLGAGDYSVVAFGFNDSQPNGNQGYCCSPYNYPDAIGAAEGMSSITYVGTGRYDNSSILDFPTTIDGGPPNRYDAGTFATPEPGFYSISAVFALALTGLSAAVRRRKSA